MNGTFYNEPAGIINVATGQELTFFDDNDGQHGTINVEADAFLTVADGKIAQNRGVINNSGIIAAEGTEGLYNLSCVGHLKSDKKTISHTTGVINILTEGAITYVQNNAGTIIMNDRDNEVVVPDGKNTGKIVYNYNYATDGEDFALKSTDRFSYVVFGADASTINLVKTDKSLSIAKISLEFEGSTTLTTNAQTIAGLTVASKANLKVGSGNKLNVDGVVTNNGTITIGGVINCKDYEGDGRKLSVGTGAINEVSTLPSI